MDARKSRWLSISAGVLSMLWLATLAPHALAQDAGDKAAEESTESASTSADKEKEDAWQKQQDALLLHGDDLLQKGQFEAAIRDAFDPVIQAHEARYRDPDTIYYCVRTPTEALLYLAGVAARSDKGENSKSAIALGPTWAYAYYGKAYALIDMKQYEEAGKLLDRALELSPSNPQFLSERGYTYRYTHQWQEMLENNRSAQEFTAIASPDHLRDAERARAMRGEGFALIELGQLKEAKKVFKASLKIEPDNAVALNELDYIKQLQEQTR